LPDACTRIGLQVTNLNISHLHITTGRATWIYIDVTQRMNELNAKLQGSESLCRLNTWQSDGVGEDTANGGNASVINNYSTFGILKKWEEESLNTHNMFNVYYNKCRDTTSVSLYSIVSPLFDPLGPSSHNPLYRETFWAERPLTYAHYPPVAGPNLSSCLTLVWSFWNFQSLRRRPAVTHCCSHSALKSYSTFQHLVHFQSTKKRITVSCSSISQTKTGATKIMA